MYSGILSAQVGSKSDTAVLVSIVFGSFSTLINIPIDNMWPIYIRYMSTNTHRYNSTHVCLCTHIERYTYICIHIYICTHIYQCIHVFRFIYTYEYMNIYI